MEKKEVERKISPKVTLRELRAFAAKLGKFSGKVVCVAPEFWCYSGGEKKEKIVIWFSGTSELHYFYTLTELDKFCKRVKRGELV